MWRGGSRSLSVSKPEFLTLNPNCLVSSHNAQAKQDAKKSGKKDKDKKEKKKDKKDGRLVC